MITIKKEKIAAMMFDIWKESDELTNLSMADEYIANKINEAINHTHSCKSDSELFYCYLETDKKCEKQCSYCLHIEGSE